jgi:hypothetical protein
MPVPMGTRDATDAVADEGCGPLQECEARCACPSREGPAQDDYDEENCAVTVLVIQQTSCTSEPSPFLVRRPCSSREIAQWALGFNPSSIRTWTSSRESNNGPQVFSSADELPDGLIRQWNSEVQAFAWRISKRYVNCICSIKSEPSM